ncbi:hypothetical protein WJ70_26965 [Burkholderia ubonensis]|uniref:methyltransferase domain-containing protein n=1 Tax=Burkholderia ubonensis TaxID=101571 RepID=UPI00075C8EE5|nr:methyltransferase domain-containing protein [Burkholderia ubonensis]KVO05324.1 hypothetical protein WJ70_26965 [Burkholderia ubonensis]
MSNANDINSDSYWNARFQENWQSNAGPEQSRFFAEIAIRNLPDWLLDHVRQDRLTVVDFGCAQGDGTDYLASHIDASQLAGVDFSSVAIEQATHRYPSIRFINADWLTETGEQSDVFDIVFSSNTLEHFEKPYKALATISRRAKKAIVLALPYQELDRIDEHFFTFYPGNIPTHLSNGFVLTWSKVVDCLTIPDTMWSGDQIILIYADPCWIGKMSLTLSDYHIDTDGVPAELRRHTSDDGDEQAKSHSHASDESGADAFGPAERLDTWIRGERKRIVVEHAEQLAELHDVLGEHREEVAGLKQMLAAQKEQISALSSGLDYAKDEIVGLRASTSWKITRPLRFAKRLIDSVFVGREKRYQFARSIYWALPANARQALQPLRMKLAGRHLTRLSRGGVNRASQPFDSVVIPAPWLDRANSAEKVAIIPCSFEFEGLVNQRPINAAKHFAAEGYFVIYVAWQWTPDQALTKGCSEVHPDIFQVPLYEFLSATPSLHPKADGQSLYLVTFPAPTLIDLARVLRSKGSTIVYDIMDEWECFAGVGQAPWFQASLERSLILEADHVTAVSPSLIEKFSDLRTDIALIGNGYNASIMGLDHSFVANNIDKPKSVVGYFGHLTDSWFDWEMLFFAASAAPEITFEIIGYGEPQWVTNKAARQSNIRLIGKVQPQDLHAYAKNWSAALIPFKGGALAEAVDPIKIYEYLYFGLPVISTGIKHVERYPYTYFSASHAEFVKSIRDAIQIDVEEKLIQQFLLDCTWKKRFSDVQKLLESPSLASLYAV